MGLDWRDTRLHSPESRFPRALERCGLSCNFHLVFRQRVRPVSLFSEGKQTTNLASISKVKLATLEVPFPPVAVANKIVAQIEIAFAWIDRLASEAQSARKLIDR